MTPRQRSELLGNVEQAAKFSAERRVRDAAIQLLPFLQQAEFELQRQLAEMEARITEAVLQRLNISTMPVEPIAPVFVRFIPVRSIIVLTSTGVGISWAVYCVGVAPLFGLAFTGFVVWFMFSAMFGRSHCATPPPPPSTPPSPNGNQYVNGAIHIESNAGNVSITQTFNQ